MYRLYAAHAGQPQGHIALANDACDYRHRLRRLGFLRGRRQPPPCQQPRQHGENARSCKGKRIAPHTFAGDAAQPGGERCADVMGAKNPAIDNSHPARAKDIGDQSDGRRDGGDIIQPKENGKEGQPCRRVDPGQHQQ